MSRPQYSHARLSNGWMKASRRRGRQLEPLAIVPTEWEDLLTQYALTEEAAGKDRRIQSWVKRNYRTRYVPEGILDLLKIPEETRA